VNVQIHEANQPKPHGERSSVEISLARPVIRPIEPLSGCLYSALTTCTVIMKKKLMPNYVVDLSLLICEMGSFLFVLNY